MAIVVGATHGFSQCAVAVFIVISLGLHDFSLVQEGAFFTVGAVDRARVQRALPGGRRRHNGQ
jgi:hypothetical protein